MNKTSTEKRAQIIACLAEGNSVRATSRLTGVAINTVIKLLCDAGRACSAYQDKVFRNLKCRRIQCDEIWSFVYAKDKNLPEHLRGREGVGSVWTWTAIDADTKLVPCWHIGTRDAGAAYSFIHDLKSRLASRVQLTTDGHKAYLTAVEDAFGCDVDYAMLQKIYGLVPTDQSEVRYSPMQCTGARRAVITRSS
jgi:IS1 family transposase